MNLKKGFINKRFILVIPLFLVVLGGGLGGWLISAEQKMPTAVSYIVIDDFTRKTAGSPGNFHWTLDIAQAKLEGKTGRIEFVRNDGKSSLHLRRPVSSGSKWSIVGARTSLANFGQGLRTSAYEGIYVRAKGTSSMWNVGLWIADAQDNVKLYQAPIELKNQWQEIQVPFHRFRALPAKRAASSPELIRLSSARQADNKKP